MKVLWLSSSRLINYNVFVSGTWVSGLYAILNEHYHDIEIINITKGNVAKPQACTQEKLVEWVIPDSKKMDTTSVNYLTGIIESIQPDIIQVWGTEDIWGLFPFKKLFPKIPVILEIQGILESVSDYYYGELTPMECVKCWSIKEFLKPSSSLPAIRHLYTRNVAREKEILKNVTNIGVQSKWSADVVKTINPEAKLFESGISLRSPFYNSAKWTISEDSKNITILSTALLGQPLKGAYTLFKAFAIVHEHFPNAKIVMAGINEHGIRRSGFNRMLMKFARKKGFYNNIIQLGPLSAEQLAEQYRSATVFVNPSNWESYSVVTAESMYIGCPTIAAYSGAMPELGVDNSVLYFPRGDYRTCASRIIDIINNKQLAVNLSKKSIRIAKERQNPSRIAQLQMSTYKQLINS